MRSPTVTHWCGFWYLRRQTVVIGGARYAKPPVMPVGMPDRIGLADDAVRMRRQLIE
jgi:hypothetical protein